MAPEIELQRAPTALQRYHWNRYETAPEPDHAPGAAVRRCPRRAIPDTEGPLVAAGPTVCGTTARVLRLTWRAAPTAAVTRATSARPRSASATV